MREPGKWRFNWVFGYFFFSVAYINLSNSLLILHTSLKGWGSSRVHAFRKCCANVPQPCWNAMLLQQVSSFFGKTVFFNGHCPDTIISSSPFLSVAVVACRIVWSAQAATTTTNYHSFSSLSSWLLVLQCSLLADKEFMLWPLFTGKNVPTCVWADKPFAWVRRMFDTYVWAVQYVIFMPCCTEVFVVSCLP